MKTTSRFTVEGIAKYLVKNSKSTNAYVAIEGLELIEVGIEPCEPEHTEKYAEYLSNYVKPTDLDFDEELCVIVE